LHHLYADANCGIGINTTGAGTVTGLDVSDCDFSDASTPASIGGTLTTPKFRNVLGYKTRNHGVAAVATGNTVSHGLAGTPDVVFPAALATGVTDINIASIGSSTFILNFGGGGSPNIAWTAVMDEAELGV